MDSPDAEGRFSVSGDAKLHGGMCKILSTIVGKVQEIFPFIEASRPRSKSGIQSLCALHVSLDKAKSLLQHCSDCSKLYLAITCDSILMKFEKARCSLQESLKRVENIVPQNIGCQILEIVDDLDVVMFELDQSEKQVGNDVISLLQKERRGSSSPSYNGELEVFRNAASKLGITSSRAALVERRALKKLIERAHSDDDKRKESIVSYLLHLMRKYSQLFRGEITDETDSAPCSPTVLASLIDVSDPTGNGLAFEKQIDKFSNFNSKQNVIAFGSLHIPPEELRCPMSLQLMYDPVVISSGQTYERACIEKWFVDGHHTCPKSQQQLPHLCLTPNYCIKGLIASWCEQNGVSIPDGPPESLDYNNSRLRLSQCATTDTQSTGSRNSCLLKDEEVVPFGINGSVPLMLNEVDSLEVNICQAFEEDELQRYESLLSVLSSGMSIRQQCKAVEQIWLLLKDDEEAKIYMGANGFVEALVKFLKSAIDESDEKAQKIGSLAIFNLAVNNIRNKGNLLSCGTIPLLQKMIHNPSTRDSAIALISNLSFLEQAKPIIGCSYAVPFLVQSLHLENPKHSSSCKHGALTTLYNLSTHPSNNEPLLNSGIIDALLSLLASNEDEHLTWTEKVLSIFINIASNQAGKLQMVSTPGLISTLAVMLDTGELTEQEQAVTCILILCNDDDHCIDMVLQEGVIPSLVSISVSGTSNGRVKAEKLLKVFREQRQRETAALQQEEINNECAVIPEMKPSCNSRSKRLGKTLSIIWKNRNFSVYQC
ncbi:hypothetical protein HPP92_012376 [Vanilla planifolia]|uniref:RING-type E3 ubiquitin transferase n=1 Tax=Vanilla planifolia TaxID=51239 RepID=A0A835R1F5_VANPL|nr:hypothetical protein HPP92_012376 [Vanilla planifolia]